MGCDRGIHVMTDMRTGAMGYNPWLACFKDSGKEGSDLVLLGKQGGFRLCRQIWVQCWRVV
jgi:electron transfer flavoprotein alpha/beta subunit